MRALFFFEANKIGLSRARDTLVTHWTYGLRSGFPHCREKRNKQKQSKLTNKKKTEKSKKKTKNKNEQTNKQTQNPPAPLPPPTKIKKINK